MADDTLDIPVGGGGDDMPAPQQAPQLCEGGNQCVALTAMANGMSNANQVMSNGFAASADRRTSRADQLSGDSQAMWSIAMTSPTVSSAMGYRTAQESGAGSARYAPYGPYPPYPPGGPGT